MSTLSSRNVLVVFSGLLPSLRGSNVLVRQFCRTMAECGHELHLCCFARPDIPLTDRTPQLPFQLHTVAPVRFSPGHRSHPHPGRFVSDIKLAALVFSTAYRVRPDLIHAHHYEGFVAALPAARAFGIPIVLHAHSLFEEELPTYRPEGFTGWLLQILGGILDRNCRPEPTRLFL